jgi:hypothetical protein
MLNEEESATRSYSPGTSPGEMQTDEFPPYETEKKTEELSIFDPFAG